MTSPRELATIIAALMHFYALSDIDPEIRQAQFAMFWLPELGEFDAAIIRDACAEWQRRRPPKEAPTPGQLRAICVELRANAEWRRNRALPKPAGAPEKWMTDIWREGGMEARDAAIAPMRSATVSAIMAATASRYRAAKAGDDTGQIAERPALAWIVERDAKARGGTAASARARPARRGCRSLPHRRAAGN